MPSLALLVGWAIVGWCGNEPRPRWPRPPGPPPPDPTPDPWGPYLMSSLMAAVGGLVGGWLFGQLFGVEQAAAAGVVVTLFGAFAGGRLAGGIAGLAMSREQ